MQQINTSASKRLTVILLMSASWFFFVTGCGKKGPPGFPSREKPPAVKDLSYKINGDLLELNWTIPKADDKPASRPAGFKVYRSKQSLTESDCKNCPLRFNEVGDVSIQDKRSEKQKQGLMNFSQSLETGYRYIYKIIIYNDYGVAGEDSNFVDFVYYGG